MIDLKNIFLIVTSVVMLNQLSAQSNSDYSKVLPGVVKITEGVYYDQFEITNVNWLEYMFWQFKNFGGRNSSAY